MRITVIVYIDGHLNFIKLCNIDISCDIGEVLSKNSSIKSNIVSHCVIEDIIVICIFQDYIFIADNIIIYSI